MKINSFINNQAKIGLTEEALKISGLHTNQKIIITPSDGKIIIQAKENKEYTLAQLLAGTTKKGARQAIKMSKQFSKKSIVGTELLREQLIFQK